MRPGFRHTLENYGDVAKKMEAAAPTELAKLGHVLDYFMKQAVEYSGTSEKTQFKIFTLQQQKQKIMEQLRADLKELDAPETTFERAPGHMFVYQHENRYYRSPEHGIDAELTAGEILTDGEWGLKYQLDPETTPRLLRKEFLIRQAKRQLMELADQQIIAQETTRRDIEPLKREAYSRSAEDKREKKFVSGWVAEKMVKNLLTKLAIDEGLDIEVLDTDIYQDVDQKIDFIVRRKTRNRGVEVETLPMTERLGIQFTTDPRPETRNRKLRQIERSKRELNKTDKIDDIVLVRVQFGYVSELWERWNKTQAPGGPDKLLDPEIKKQIVDQLTAFGK
jgi:hypothetical protein